MNDEGEPIYIAWTFALLERDRTVHEIDLQRSAWRNVQVRHVAGMLTLGRHHAVLLVVRIEMTSRRREWRLALSDSVNMEGVITRGKTVDREGDQHATRRGLRQLGRADVFPVRGFECRFRALCGRRQRRDGGDRARQSGCPQEGKDVHAGLRKQLKSAALSS